MSARIGMLVGLSFLMALIPLSAYGQQAEAQSTESSEQTAVENQETAGRAEEHGQEAEEDPMLEATALPTNARFIGLGIFLVAVLLSIVAIRKYLGRLEEERQIGL